MSRFSVGRRGGPTRRSTTSSSRSGRWRICSRTIWPESTSRSRTSRSRRSRGSANLRCKRPISSRRATSPGDEPRLARFRHLDRRAGERFGCRSLRSTVDFRLLWRRSVSSSWAARSRTRMRTRSGSACSRDGHSGVRRAGDVAVVNTCCVTHEAVRKSRKAAARRAHARTGLRDRLRREPLRGRVPRPAGERHGGARRASRRPPSWPVTSVRSAASRPMRDSTVSEPSSRCRTAAASRATSA